MRYETRLQSAAYEIAELIRAARKQVRKVDGIRQNGYGLRAPSPPRAERYQGKLVRTFYVTARLADGAVLSGGEIRPQTVLMRNEPIAAHSAADAANWVVDALSRRPVGEIGPFEVECIGPKGGRVYRHQGWFGRVSARTVQAVLS